MASAGHASTGGLSREGSWSLWAEANGIRCCSRKKCWKESQEAARQGLNGEETEGAEWHYQAIEMGRKRLVLRATGELTP